MMFTMVLLASALSQPPAQLPAVPQAPPVVKPMPVQAPPMKPVSVLPDYYHGYVAAKKSGAVCVVFINAPERQIKGAECYTSHPLTDGIDNVILVTVPARSIRKYLPSTATDAAIAQAVQEVSRVRDPFDPFSSLNKRTAWAAPDDQVHSPVGEDSPWLSKEEHEKVFKMWPNGVPLPKDLRFYKIPQVFQSMYTMSNGTRRFNDKLPVVNEEEPWNASGGMHHVDRSQWRNVTGLELPGGIAVWSEDTDVGAFAPVPKVRWRFPAGAKAFDVLIRKGDPEHIFEVRVQEKLEDGWDDGTIYRPKAKGDNKRAWTWAFNNFPEAWAITYDGEIPKSPEFEPTRELVTDDGGFYPKGYRGTGLGCNKCHGKVGELTSYANARRGDDGRFSWHPFDTAGNIDRRWPLTSR